MEQQQNVSYVSEQTYHQWSSSVRRSGKYAVITGWLMAVIVGLILLGALSAPPIVILAVLPAAVAVGYIIYGTKIKKLQYKNTDKYLKRLLWLTGIYVVVTFLLSQAIAQATNSTSSGGLGVFDILLIILFFIFRSARKSFAKLSKIKEFEDTLQ